MATATENVILERPEEEDTGPGFWGGVRDLFSLGSEYNEADEESLAYERRLWDRRIERYLDSSLPDYVHDFGILDEIALHVREERVQDLSTRSHELITFVRSLDGDLGVQEERLAAVEKIARKKSA